MLGVNATRPITFRRCRSAKDLSSHAKRSSTIMNAPYIRNIKLPAVGNIFRSSSTGHLQESASEIDGLFVNSADIFT